MIKPDGVEGVALYFEDAPGYKNRVVEAKFEGKPLCIVSWENGIEDIRVERLGASGQSTSDQIPIDTLVTTLLCAQRLIETGAILGQYDDPQNES